MGKNSEQKTKKNQVMIKHGNYVLVMRSLLKIKIGTLIACVREGSLE